MGCRSCFLSRPSQACLAILALVLIIGGILLSTYRSSLFDRFVLPNLVLVPGSPAYPSWKDFPVPLVTSIYFFNVTNSNDVLKKGAKPDLKEVGPYVYNEWHHKTRIAFNHANGTSTYQQRRVWFFDREKTPKHLHLSDHIITLNAPAASANAILKTQTPFVQGAANLAFKVMNEELFVKKTVSQLLFDGYKDPILTDTQWLPKSVVPVKMDKFGYFYPRNNTDWFDGVFNMNTGELGISSLGQIQTWNYSNTVPFFPGQCGKVYGAGDFPSPGQFHPTLEMFSNDMCRTLSLDFQEEISYNGNIVARKYAMTPRFFANKTVNPANACFNPENEVPSGVFNVSTCRFGAPILMSQPHFYQADPVYLKAVKGMKPVPETHDTTFIIEPESGVPINVAARFQVNFYMENIRNIDMFKNLPPKIVFPALWMESVAIVEGSSLEQIYLVANLKDFLLIGGLAFVGFGVAYFILVAVVYLGMYMSRRHSSSSVEEEASPVSPPSEASLLPREEVEPTSE